MSKALESLRRQAPVLAWPMAPAFGERWLGPGDVCLARRGETLQTLLGSCVAIILTDPARTLASICHYVHAGPSRATPEDSCHAESALQAMCVQLRDQGLNPCLCQAFVYGGANMFPGIFAGRHVGQANSRWALQTLAAMGVSLAGCDVGGLAYRRLRWRVGPADPLVSLGSQPVGGRA